MHTKSKAGKPWSKTNYVSELSGSPIPYIYMKTDYKEILAKCGFNSPANMTIDLLKILAYKPYNRFVIAPIRLVASLFKTK